MGRRARPNAQLAAPLGHHTGWASWIAAAALRSRVCRTHRHRTVVCQVEPVPTRWAAIPRFLPNFDAAAALQLDLHSSPKPRLGRASPSATVQLIHHGGAWVRRTVRARGDAPRPHDRISNSMSYSNNDHAIRAATPRRSTVRLPRTCTRKLRREIKCPPRSWQAPPQQTPATSEPFLSPIPVRLCLDTFRGHGKPAWSSGRARGSAAAVSGRWAFGTTLRGRPAP